MTMATFSNLPEAKIVAVETIPLCTPLAKTAGGSTLKLTHRSTIFTRIHTDAGVIGECFNGNDLELQPEIIKMIHEELVPLVMGKNVAAVEEIWNVTRRSTFPFLRDRRVALRAQACIDTAIHDAIGKLAALPLHVLWGGGRPVVPVVALGGYYREKDELEGLTDEVFELKELGIGGLKLKVGGRTPREDAERARAVRKAGGAAFILAVDANQNWTRQEAIEFARITSDLQLAWFEEPCRWDNDRREMAIVRTTTGVPISAGQSELSRYGCRDLMIQGAIDICNFDASWGGGPTEWRRVAALASCFDVRVMQHLEAHIGIMLCAGVSNGLCAEVTLPWRDPFFYRLIANNERPFREGHFVLSDKCGWGWDYDMDYLRAMRVS
jgi:D-galactarolactone cycloisomerase